MVSHKTVIIILPTKNKMTLLAENKGTRDKAKEVKGSTKNQ